MGGEKAVSENEKSLKIRNSTAEFLMFAADSASDSIEVMLADENVWLTQDMIATLYDKGRSTISEHLANVFSDVELVENSVCRKFRRTAPDGKEYNTKFYSLEAVSAVGFRTNSERAILFRNWASRILKDFSIRGYVIDQERLKNGSFLNEDYSVDASITQTFFKTVQNKLHFAIHGKTAAELIVERADAEQENMGLTTWKNAPTGKIVKSDVAIAKNYLSLDEIDGLNRIITMYLDYAENQAKRKIPMTMEDWASKLNAFLQFNEYEILNHAGKVTAEIAKAFAESEFEKYRVIQDCLFESDFDKFAKGLIKENKV